MAIAHFTKDSKPKDSYTKTELANITDYVNGMSQREQIEYVTRHIRIGNHKVSNNTMIFNMTPALTCPTEKIGLCKHCDICYAKKAEVMYLEIFKFRQRQEIIYDNITPFKIVEAAIKLIARKKIPLKYFRFSESGDFKNQNSVDKMSIISSMLHNEGIVTYGYTARDDLNFDNLRTYAIISGSNKMYNNRFDAVDKFDPKLSPYLCAGDCSICNLCKTRGNKIIQVIKH